MRPSWRDVAHTCMQEALAHTHRHRAPFHTHAHAARRRRHALARSLSASTQLGVSSGSGSCCSRAAEVAARDRPVAAARRCRRWQRRAAPLIASSSSSPLLSPHAAIARTRRDVPVARPATNEEASLSVAQVAELIASRPLDVDREFFLCADFIALSTVFFVSLSIAR